MFPKRRFSALEINMLFFVGSGDNNKDSWCVEVLCMYEYYSCKSWSSKPKAKCSLTQAATRLSVLFQEIATEMFKWPRASAKRDQAAQIWAALNQPLCVGLVAACGMTSKKKVLQMMRRGQSFSVLAKGRCVEVMTWSCGFTAWSKLRIVEVWNDQPPSQKHSKHWQTTSGNSETCCTWLQKP